MCGIAGIVNWGDRQTLQRMTDILAHRGPDDQGTWETTLPDGTWLGLGSRRLSIIDLSPAGHMPMSTEDGHLTVVYNGEVYNYKELRRYLEARGHRFRSHTDTEVVLCLYREHGPGCLGMLKGMFALAIWDRQANSLFLARDHFGVKPLYYSHRGGHFAFASEIKSLMQIPDIRRDINDHALHQYLTFLWVPDPRTLFEEIVKLPAGHYGVFKDGNFTLRQYWDLEFPLASHAFSTDERALAAELRARFSASVREQMVSDVPIGAFLSAGLDSTSIVAMMAEAGEKPVRTFTITFPEKHVRGGVTYDDPTVARRTSEQFGSHHTEIVVEPDVATLLPELVWHMDEPIADPAIIPAYLVCREARKDTTVLLSGVGGDELFGGYRKHQAHFWAEQYRKIPPSIRSHFIEPAVGRVPSLRGTPLKGYVRLAKKMVRSGSLPPRERFLMDSTYLTPADLRLLCREPLLARFDGSDPHNRHQEYFNRVSHADFLNQMLYLDSKAFMVSLNLTYTDKMSMANSVEVRVPFLDWELAEWAAWNIPPNLKLKENTTKYILRAAMKDILRGEVLKQKKAGFAAPADYWLAHDLRGMTDDLLNESALIRRGMFKPEAVSSMLKEHRSGKTDWSMQLWQLLTLEIWMRIFIDGTVRPREVGRAVAVEENEP